MCAASAASLPPRASRLRLASPAPARPPPLQDMCHMRYSIELRAVDPRFNHLPSQTRAFFRRLLLMILIVAPPRRRTRGSVEPPPRI